MLTAQPMRYRADDYPYDGQPTDAEGHLSVCLAFSCVVLV